MLCDGWEYATAYEDLLNRADAGWVVAAWPDGNGLSWYTHPLPENLEAVFLSDDESHRLGAAVALTAIVRERAPALSEGA